MARDGVSMKKGFRVCHARTEQKMDFSALFNVFSRRPEGSVGKDPDIPKTTRSRIIQYWQTQFGGSMVSADIWRGFWAEILQMLQMRLGTPLIHEAFGGSPQPPAPEHALRYVLEGPGAAFLDFLEDIFRTQTYHDMRLDPDKFVGDINQLLRVDNLPYHVTSLVSETTTQGRTIRYRIIALPKVVMRDSDVLHTSAMEPTLQLLQNPIFENANTEFLKALEDYRKGDYSDCLTKCGSSFESFMKILCDKKGWPYKQTDTASTLIKTILANTRLDAYFEQLLMIIGTLRNKLSSAHGAGTSAKNVPQHLARYAVNATASALILLADETQVA